MKFNKQGKDELRLIIEKQLINVPQGQRIHLDKDLLEELLFETIVYHKESGKILKLPVWSGEFLSKIDLSEISFEDVAWSLIVPKDELSLVHVEGIDYDIKEKLEKQYYGSLPDFFSDDFDDKKIINYSNTNAKIDFSKSWEKKVMGDIKLEFCNFSGTDLSNNLLNDIWAFYCDLSYTKIPFDSKGTIYSIDRIIDTNLSGLDLSNVTYDAGTFYDLDHTFAPDCNFYNTGLHIIYNENSILNDDIRVKESVNESLGKALKEGRLVGCYINNRLITSTEQSQIVKQEKKSEYEQMKNDLFAAVTQSIEEQKKSFTR